MADETAFDGFFIQIGLIEHPWGGADRYYSEFFAQLPPSHGDLDELLEDIEGLASYKEDDTLKWRGYKSEIKRGHSSWGADGSELTLLLEMAAGAGGTAVYEGIQYLIHKYADRYANRHIPEYNDEQMIAHAKMLIVRKYNVLNNQLETKSIELDASEKGKATIQLVANGNEPISIKFRMIEGIGVIEWIRRELPPGVV